MASTPTDDSGIPTAAVVLFGSGIVLAAVAAGITWVVVGRRT